MCWVSIMIKLTKKDRRILFFNVKEDYLTTFSFTKKNFTIIGVFFLAMCIIGIGALGKYCWQVNRKCSKCNDDKSDDSVINLRFSSGPSLGDGGVHLLGPKNFLQTTYFWDKISSLKKSFLWEVDNYLKS